jgi:starch-binding outer membrane protein, SusD/RagB family
MMTNKISKRRISSGFGTVLAMVVLLPALTACDSFFDVRYPGTIEASSVDPVGDGTMFSRSAFQTFAAALGNLITYTGWFSNEAWVGDTFPTRNEYGRRFIDFRNGTHSGEVWFPLLRGISQAEQVMEILGGVSGQELNLARAALTSGFGLTIQAEAFCEGTMRGPGNTEGELMTSVQLLETAVNRFDQAIQLGSAATGTEATQIVSAARVGKGRALLQLGRRAEAASAVSGVATAFVFNVPFVDDTSNRGRLGNGVYFWSFGGLREALVVPPHYLVMNDPRVQFNDAGKDAQDGTLRLWNQRKYPAWNSPIRLASGLEARYIEVEAGQNAATMLAFVNERRAAGNQAPISTTNVQELMAELMAQRSRDFWLEAKRMGDWRRNPGMVPNILPPGNNYYKPELGDVQSQTCFPLPFAECNANSKIPCP